MGIQRWFYRDEDDWIALVERLKLTPCPHCKKAGALIRHGVLRGFDERSPQRKTVRARRIFCSNRHRRLGCGRTFSVWAADKIRRLSVTTDGLWAFLKRAAAGSIAAAIRAADGPLSDRTWQRLWKRFDRGQSAIRTALFGQCPPPEPSIRSSTSSQAERRPAATHVLVHLQCPFPRSDRTFVVSFAEFSSEGGMVVTPRIRRRFPRLDGARSMGTPLPALHDAYRTPPLPRSSSCR